MYKQKNDQVNWNRMLQGLLMFAIIALIFKTLGGGWWLFFVLPFFFGCGGWGMHRWNHSCEVDSYSDEKPKNDDARIV